ncbi:phycobilisome rod-core linker polypeptide [cf. Phormidesmis sp. LEGE 11477]|uniref:phycobilisome rod-core linker polypeptide n=1 Tax=cf. Phormidesmis sp. LEGE 11477 TaxID=1828680 RepID=UPI00187EDBDA|nr:phycobilisome rod-core linker polypeptide [cf. Phormidesmis sp. LEGE 11477]MBE9060211.1 phycobilisome rod-core linker polypeptide [cf. Phormidesmis sp. LEGE 11477]
MADAYTYELWPTSTKEEIETIIRAVYKQVLGNPHVMESERLTTTESQLFDKSLSVREFVRAVAKSDFYKSRYFENCGPYRSTELNFQHILGRAPQSQVEASEHIRRCAEEGFDADIDSYVDSDEYQQAFGENVVPFQRDKSEVGRKQVVYNRNFAVNRGPAQVSSAVTNSQLVYAVATNSANKITTAEATPGSVTEKRFKIKTTAAKFDRPRRVSFDEYIVSATKMTPQIQRIQRTGAKIVSITEIK